jgi:hypothetical protein
MMRASLFSWAMQNRGSRDGGERDMMWIYLVADESPPHRAPYSRVRTGASRARRYTAGHGVTSFLYGPLYSFVR